MDVGRDYRRTGPDRRAAALQQTLQAAPAGQWRQNGRQRAALKASGRPETGPVAQQEAQIESAHVHQQPLAHIGMAPDEDPTQPSGFAPDGPRVVPPVRSAGAAIAGCARHEGAAGCRRRPVGRPPVPSSVVVPSAPVRTRNCAIPVASSPARFSYCGLPCRPPRPWAREKPPRLLWILPEPGPFDVNPDPILEGRADGVFSGLIPFLYNL